MENLQTWLTFLVPLAVMILLIWRKADPIIFLFLAALTAGLVAGMPLGTEADTIVTSFGTMLQTAGLVLVFGTVYAHFLSASGGGGKSIERPGAKGWQ